VIFKNKQAFIKMKKEKNQNLNQQNLKKMKRL